MASELTRPNWCLQTNLASEPAGHSGLDWNYMQQQQLSIAYNRLHCWLRRAARPIPQSRTREGILLEFFKSPDHELIDGYQIIISSAGSTASLIRLIRCSSA